MKISKPILLVGATVVFLLLVMLAPLWTPPAGMQTSYSYAPSGHRAFFEMATEVRGHVERWRRLPMALSGTGRALCFIEPQAHLIEEAAGAADSLVEWVEHGNDLIVIPRATSVMVTEVLSHKFEIVRENDFGEYGLSPLLHAFHAEVELSSSMAGAEQLGSYSYEKDGPGIASGLAVGSMPTTQVLDIPKVLTPVRWVDGQPVVYEKQVGAGRLVLILAPAWFLNKNLVDNDHAFLVMEMLQPYGREGLLIDEFFHGLPEVSGLGGLLFHPPFLWLTLCFIFLFLSFLWASLYRTQPEQSTQLPTRRNKREYLDALGCLMANAQDSSGIVQRLQQGLEADLLEKLRLSPQTEIEVALEFLMRSDLALCEDLVDALEEGESLTDQPNSSPALVAWGRRMHLLRKKMNHE